MVKYYDISDWEEHKYFNTGGTRDKVVVENPEDRSLYYFKTSLKKELIDYTYEFWSEIIASEIGRVLGLDVLHYDVAWNKNCLGCLSKSMVESQHAELQEGYKWLVGFNPDYDVNNKEAYTFQAIENLMKNRFEDENFIVNIIRIVVFDSVIGNEDRHQENWSIIVSNQAVGKSSRFRKKTVSVRTSYSFAPIYDSGSSMGRELGDSKIRQMLTDSVQLEAYINRGRSEIHWAGEKRKLKHFDLISRISNNGYRNIVIDILDEMKSKYDETEIANIVNDIDKCIPQEHSLLKIPQERKDFLIKLVSLRAKKLFELHL